MRLSGKFTPEEAEIIKTFQNKFDMNDNQLVKNSVKLFVELNMGLKALQDNPTMMKFLKKMNNQQKTEMDKKGIQSDLEKQFSKNPKDLEKFISSFEELSKTEKILEKKKKVGRKAIKRKRGRPDP